MHCLAAYCELSLAGGSFLLVRHVPAGNTWYTAKFVFSRTMLFNVKSFSVLFFFDELGIMIRGTMDGDSAKHRKVKKTKTGLLSNDLYRRLGDNPET